MKHDLAVYGGTPAGILASVAAARGGLRVVLVEPTGHLGGLITSGLNATDIAAPTLTTGIAREFFTRTGAYYDREIEWRPESRVALRVFEDMLREAGVTVHKGARAERLQFDAKRIKTAELVGGEPISADYWIDATYEGDLLPLAQVSHTWGRESRDTYGETYAGRNTPAHMLPWGRDPVSPLDQFGRRLPFVSDYDGLALGAGDRSLQSYSFRLTLTRNIEKRIPIPKPTVHNPEDYELFRRLAPKDGAIAEKGTTYRCGYFNLAALPNDKYDMNSGPCMPMNLPSLNGDWLDPAKRQQVYETYKEYSLGALYFIQNDESVPGNIREFFSKFGLCADEYESTGGWPPMLYVREGRRLVGEQVLTEHDVLGKTPPASDYVGSAKYALDCKPMRWMVSGDGKSVVREGMFFHTAVPAYRLPYRMMLPKRTECGNLLAACAVSASHVAFASLRMEPHWMLLGAAAGYAATIAKGAQIELHDVAAEDIRTACGSSS